MDARILVLGVLFVFACFYVVDADFLYNHVSPKEDQLEKLGLKCIPGHTIIKIGKPEPAADSEDDHSDESRRSHMRFKTDDEICQVCVCSIEGKDKYCSNRPAKNVNECILTTKLLKRFNESLPFEHERSLAYRIRRDYIWHNDEIPYNSKSRCQRGHSYYTNSINAKNTDIDLDSSIESLLDYSNKKICFYCVCNVDGMAVSCISRAPWYCEYYRNIRDFDAMRHRYRHLFLQDRPVYFRQLSYRLRRTMDGGMFDLVDTGGDTVCCDHPSGHRMNLHNKIRGILQKLKRKVNKENVMQNYAGGDYVDFVVNNDFGSDSSPESCVPFVSEYTDCTEENQCEGCKKCTCNSKSQWSCEKVKKCAPGEQQQESDLDDNDVDEALETMLIELKGKEVDEQLHSQTPLVPRPPNSEERRELDQRELLLELKEKNFEDDILALMREKRSVDNRAYNDTVKFYNTKDELNEDTLKLHNITGTLKAKKFDPKIITRRTNLSHNSSSNSLQIEYTQPKIYKHHITDNKIDTPPEEKIDSFVQHQLSDMLGNHSLNEKNQNLSQVVVSEMAVGNEVIGDPRAPIISNITFQQQNDTITAMALIAGNLLNKLWNMEKDSVGDAIDLEMLRHEKIEDLIELFKEPLNLRQQLFLKNALEQLSTAIDKNKDVQSISLCENVEKVKKAEAARIQKDCGMRKSNEDVNATDIEAADKIAKILDLIKKYEQVQKKIEVLRSAAPSANVNKFITNDEKSFLDNYGTVLNTLTKMLLPRQQGKKLKKAIQNSNFLTKENAVKQKVKDMYNLDLGNMSVTTKDKIVLDYLTHMQSRPDCLLKKQKSFVLPDVDGNILFNLSEFFKIKTMPDLLKLFGINNHPVLRAEEQQSTVKNIGTTTTTTTKTTTDIADINTTDINTADIDTADIDPVDFVTASKESINNENKSKFESTKEKLKDHLKVILKDLIELQNIEGKSADGKNIKIADALPCIYNLLENSKDRVSEKLSRVDKDKFNEKLNNVSKTKTSNSKPTEKVKEIFDNLKQDLKFTQTRRSNSIPIPRPKSAVVWERVIKSLDEKKTKTRRTMSETPKSLEEIKKTISHLESTSSNSYKNYAYLYEVPSADRYLLLKTFQSEVNKYIEVLKDIKTVIDPMTLLEIEDSQEIKNFIENAAKNINLNEKIVKNLDKPKTQINSSVIKNNFKLKRPRVRPVQLIESKSVQNAGLKLTREQLIIQLIKNRVQNYLKTKDIQRAGKNDMSYDIAKKILTNLEIGNYELAKELYKIFASRKLKGFGNSNRGETSTGYSDNSPIFNRGQIQKEPLIQFDDTNNKNPMMNQDHIIKQLLNFRRKIKI